MYFAAKREKDIVIINVDLTRATMKEAEELKLLVVEEIEKKTKKFIIDFTTCEFMDSTFISALITSLKNVTKSGGRMVLANLHSEVLSLMELTGTSKVFSFYASVPEAEKSF